MARCLNKVYLSDVVLEDETRTSRLRGCYLVALIFIVLVLAMVFYMGFATYTTLPRLQTTHIQTMVVKSRKAQTLSLETHVAVQVSFEVPSGIKASSQLGTFVLITTINKTLILRAVTDSMYDISGNVQLLSLEFQSPGLLSLNKSDNESIWMWLEGDFKMHVKLTHFPLFPKIEHHAKFMCYVSLKNAQLDRINHQQCYVTSPVRWY